MLSAPLPGVRWTPEDNLHLTLRFHGDASAAQAAAVAERLAREAATAPFAPVRFEGIDQWPGVVLARFAAPPALGALQERLEQQAVALGFAPEARAWAPHVTLARTPRDTLVELPKIKLAPFELAVARLVLFERALEGEQRYVRRASFELATA